MSEVERVAEWVLALDGKGGATELEAPPAGSSEGADTLTWVHLDYQKPGAQAWLAEVGVPEIYLESLVLEAPRPRVLAVKDHLLVVLRGINRNEGQDPEDMVAVRMWIDGRRVITLRHRRVAAMADLREELLAGDGPRDAAGFVAEVLQIVLRRIGDTVEEVVDRVDEFEELLLEDVTAELRAGVGAARREAIALRRHVAPQRDAVARLATEKVSWLDDTDRAHLRELGDRATRILEDLDAARDRAALIQDQVTAALGEQANRIMYFLSVVTAIFLPLGLLTGLLGINVGGMPGVDSPWAFTIVSVLLVVLALVLALVFRWARIV